MKIEPHSPYPYLPGYHGTIDEMNKAVKKKLEELLRLLQMLEKQKTDISLLAEIEKCQSIVEGMLEN